MTQANGFRGCTVIITGASAGIGAASARLFAESGANLVLVARGSEGLEALARELQPLTGVLPFAADVTDTAALRRMVDAARERFGRIDVLVNNAGCNVRGSVEDVSVEDLQQIIDVNLRAPVTLIRLALPWLRESRQPAIVNVASIAGRFPLPHEAAYSATKFALRAFSFALAEELHDSGIRVSVVSPGPVETGFILDDLDDVPDLVFAQPMSTADEIAALVFACAGDGNRERVTPAVSGKLATLGYLFPPAARILRPLMEVRGRRVKRRYGEQRGSPRDLPLR